MDYSDAVKRWHVANKSADHDRNSLAYTKYGTARVSGYELLELALNLRDVQVFDVKIVDGKEKRIPNPHETIKARNKQDALRQAFKDWIYSDPDRARTAGGLLQRTLQPHAAAHIQRGLPHFPGHEPQY